MTSYQHFNVNGCCLGIGTERCAGNQRLAFQAPETRDKLLKLYPLREEQ